MPVSLPGRWLDPAGVERDCIVRCGSVDAMEIAVSTVPTPGDRVVCRVPGLGTLTGTAAGPVTGGFRLTLSAGPALRGRLAARLAWHGARARGAIERRAGARVVPTRREVVVAWGGAEGPGRLQDVSAHGAAIELSPRPPVGTPVTVGHRRAYVVRLMETAIGVRFVLPLREEDVTEDVVL